MSFRQPGALAHERRYDASTVIIARLLGVAITCIGAALTYNMSVLPVNRFGGRQFDVVMLFGPALALLGVVVFFDFLSFAPSTRRTRTPAELLASISLPRPVLLLSAGLVLIFMTFMRFSLAGVSWLAFAPLLVF